MIGVDGLKLADLGICVVTKVNGNVLLFTSTYINFY